MKHTKTSKGFASACVGGNKMVEHVVIDARPSYSCGTAHAQGFNDLGMRKYDSNGDLLKTGKTVYDVMYEWVNNYRKPLVFTMIDSVMSPETVKKEQKKGNFTHVKHICSFETWHGTYMVSLYCLSIDDEA